MDVPQGAAPGQAEPGGDESTCHEGNYGLLGMMANTRASERLFREGKGPAPATQDNATGGGGGGGGLGGN